MSITIKTAGLHEYMEGGKAKLRFLLLGTAGSGKTRFGSFAPKPIFADCENGILSVADRGVPYAEIESTEDMDAFLTTLEFECKKPPAQRRWETVIIDTLDTYERHVIHNYLKKKRRTEMDGWEDWGYLSAEMTSVIERLSLLDMNVIVLCHTKSVSRKGQVPEDQFILRLKGDLGQQLPNDFDFVGMIQQEFGPGDDGREVIRNIRWESTPAAPFLKFRGGGTKSTPLVFADSDFAAVRDAILSRVKDMKEGEVIETVETKAEVTPAVAPGPGVAVPVSKSGTAPKAPPAPPKAPPAPPAPPRPPAAVAPVPPAPKPQVAPVPPATKPDLTPPVETVEEAVANVQAAMPGSTVISDSEGKIAPETPASEQTVQGETVPPADGGVVEEPTTTPVAEVGPAADQEVPAVDTPEEAAPAAEAAVEGTEPARFEVPDDGYKNVRCGDPRFTGGTPKGNVPGCGKELTVTLEAARVIAVSPPPEQAQFVEMAGLRERAFLCNACFKEARTKSLAPSQ